jgi:hypothetical protein
MWLETMGPIISFVVRHCGGGLGRMIFATVSGTVIWFLDGDRDGQLSSSVCG